MKRALFLIALIALFCASTVVSAEAAPAIRVDSPAKAFSSTSAISVRVDAEQFRASSLGDILEIEVPTLGVTKVVHDRREVMPTGNLYWSGYLEAEGGGRRVEFALSGNAIMGTVRSSAGDFVFDFDGSTTTVRSHHHTEGVCADPIHSVPTAKAGEPKLSGGEVDALLTQGDSSTEVVTIDVLLLYSPGVARANGAALQQYLDLLWGGVRSRYAASDTRISLRLVASSEVAYTGAKDLITAAQDVGLSELYASAPGYPAPRPELSQVFQLRASVGADMVLLLMHPSDLINSCTASRAPNCTIGTASLPSIDTWRLAFDGAARSAYAVVENTDYTSLTMAHELGHILAANHARTDSGGCGSPFPYSCALKQPRSIVGTIMAQGTQQGNYDVFSNPSLTVCDGPCGAPEGDSNAADNARAIRRSRFLVARYQPTKVAEVLGDVTGIWWVPSESGWGLTMSHRRDVVFAAWYTYDATGAAKWYVASDCRLVNRTCSGRLYEAVYGGPFNVGAAFDPTKVSLTDVGQIAIDYANTDRATMSYSIRGVGFSKTIERMVFRSSGVVGTSDWNGLWNKADEAGWGISITQQFDVLFVAWFTYATDGKPTWYVASSCALSAARNGCTGELYAVTGPIGPEGTSIYSAANLKLRTVGSLTLSFSGSDAGQMTYTVDGRQGSRAIARTAF